MFILIEKKIITILLTKICLTGPMSGVMSLSSDPAINMYFHSILPLIQVGQLSDIWECSGSVVECLSQDQGAAGLSLTGITALCP